MYTFQLHIIWLVLFAVCSFGALVGSFILLRRKQRNRARSFQILEASIHRYARGELNVRIPSLLHPELLPLVSALNHMSSSLRTFVSQRNELDAVLSSMVEGVVAVDEEELIIRLNDAASELLNVKDPIAARGRPIQEVVRNSDFEKIVREVLGSGDSVEREITLHDGRGKFLEAHATLLTDSDGDRIGALVVLNDTTKLKRLETLRRDFVANVSHELKTPITSIKGFVETLLDGALENPEDSRKFLQIVSRQSDRLNSIIEDLLILSQIEQEDWKERFRLENQIVRPILISATEICSPRAVTKGIELDLVCDEAIQAAVNPSLLEQAAVNLIDNAIKYSDAGTRVIIAVTQSPTEVVLSIKDQGPGIQDSHISRVFERFYRVDEGRSRKIGGTGLGLAIVKHIAQVHGGRASVESTAGNGSLFSIHLPTVVDNYQSNSK